LIAQYPAISTASLPILASNTPFPFFIASHKQAHRKLVRTASPTMASAKHQEQQKVHLSLTLRTSPPHTISVHEAFPSMPLKLIAMVEQTASPFPDRAITILTKYSCLAFDTPSHDGAFFSQAMASPKITEPDDSCPAPELPLRPVGKWITIRHMSGDPDLLKRPEDPGFAFLTVPPVGKGHAEVVWELTPTQLLRRLGDKNESVEDKMQRFLRPGDTYKIVPENLRLQWWTFGSLGNKEGRENTKVARWSLPDDMLLVREPGEDETDEVAHRLGDWVDLHDVNKLSSRSAVEDEQVPDIGKMRADGWVFGETQSGLELTAANKEEGAQFTIIP
jgi:hypothetical protein